MKIIINNNLKTIFPPQDNNGSIENEELRGFLKDLLELVKKVCYYIILFYILKLKWSTNL